MLEGKIAIVTGASTGIGKAIALGLAKEGANVAINYYKSEAAAKDIYTKTRKMGRNSLLVPGDVALEEDANQIVSSTLHTFGRIDILVNNAGLRTFVLCGVDKCPIMEMKIEEWDRMIAVNLRGPFLMSKAVLPHMIKQRSGSIINISSNAGYRAVPGRAAYTASKHGLEGFTKALAGEVKDFDVRINTLAPGGLTNVDGRGGMPVDVIIPSCNFLASDDSRHITGESIIATNWNREKGIKNTSHFLDNV
jgi:3-oxoacyl-[acyl-carrier protein] reductase